MLGSRDALPWSPVFDSWSGESQEGIECSDLEKVLLGQGEAGTGAAGLGQGSTDILRALQEFRLSILMASVKGRADNNWDPIR